jgi:hypothetical protein
MVVERRRADAELGSETAHGELLPTVTVDQSACGGQDLGARGDAGPAGAAARCGGSRLVLILSSSRGRP